MFLTYMADVGVWLNNHPFFGVFLKSSAEMLDTKHVDDISFDELDRRAEALVVLKTYGITDLRVLEDLQKSEDEFACKILGLNPKHLSIIKRWNKLTTPQKIDSLIGTPTGFQAFTSLAISQWFKEKKIVKGRWKKQQLDTHTRFIRQKLDEFDNGRPFDQDILLLIVIRCFYLHQGRNK